MQLGYLLRRLHALLRGWLCQELCFPESETDTASNHCNLLLPWSISRDLPQQLCRCLGSCRPLLDLMLLRMHELRGL